jgi:hypothetical protein
MINPEEQQIPDEELGETKNFGLDEPDAGGFDISSKDLEAGFDSLIQDEPPKEQEVEPVSSAEGHEDETRELPILKQKELASMSLSTPQESEPAAEVELTVEEAEQTPGESESDEVLSEHGLNLTGSDVESTLDEFLSDSLEEEQDEPMEGKIGEEKKVPKHLLKKDKGDEPIDIRKKPSTPTIATVTLAEIYLTQGMKAQALDIYRKLQEREPDNTNIANRIEEIEQIPDDNAKRPIWEREDKRRIRSKGGIRYKRRRP